VSKTLRAIETEKFENLALQTVLNNTRTAYGKLRNEVTELEKKSAASENEGRALAFEKTPRRSDIPPVDATRRQAEPSDIKRFFTPLAHPLTTRLPLRN
jgi:hypothetical protein